MVNFLKLKYKLTEQIRNNYIKINKSKICSYSLGDLKEKKKLLFCLLTETRLFLLKPGHFTEIINPSPGILIL